MVCPDTVPLEPQQVPVAFPYSGLLSNIGNAVKLLNADDTYSPSNSKYAELTIKVRTLGTNNYIAIGNSRYQDTRFTLMNQSKEYKSKIINGIFIPLRITDFAAVGDTLNGAGVLEISGIEVKL